MKLQKLQNWLKNDWLKIGVILIIVFQLSILVSILTAKPKVKKESKIETACWLPEVEMAGNWQSEINLYYDKKLYLIESCLTAIKDDENKARN